MQKNTFIPEYQDELNYLFLVQTLKIVNLNKFLENSVGDKTLKDLDIPLNQVFSQQTNWAGCFFLSFSINAIFFKLDIADAIAEYLVNFMV